MFQTLSRRGLVRKLDYVLYTFVLALPSCSDSALPVNGAADEVGQVILEMAFATNGCATAGLLSSTIVRSTQDAYTLTGDVFIEGNSSEGDCYEPRSQNADCVFEIPFSLQVLDEAEIVRLHKLMDAVPPGVAPPAPNCDTCAFVVFAFLGRTEELDQCRDDPNLGSLRELLAFLTQLAIGESEE